MSKKAIYLLDPAYETSVGMSSDAMPLQIGLVGAHCLRELGDEVEVGLFKLLPDLEAAVSEKPPFIIGISNYLWTLDLGYQTAAVLKRKFPNVVVVAGGPNYPDEYEDQVEFLKTYPLIDIYIYKDGEVPFAGLVKFLLEHGSLRAAQVAKLSSCHAMVDGQPHFGETAPRIRDLSTLESPYLTGLMDKFFDQKLMPVMQTNRGCPFTCTFCTEGGSYYTKVYKTTLDRKIAEVDYIAARVKHTRTLRITDSNFGMFEEDQDFCRYLGEMQAKVQYPEYVMCSTGKNRKERVLKCNELLNHAMRLTASVQSLDPAVLKASKRDNISVEALTYVSDETSETDTHAYSELILALPNDSVGAHEASMDGLMKIGIGNITQHQLALIHGTELKGRQTLEQYGYKARYRPIQRCVGRHHFLGEDFTSVEIEEIAVETNTLSYADYLGLRQLYLTVGIFYNDRMFGEIHGLLRLLRLPTFEWIKLIHANIAHLSPEVGALYAGFTEDTIAELWETRDALVQDVTESADRYTRGEAGGNIIYKYRAKVMAECFAAVHAMAFEYLRRYLAEKGLTAETEEAVRELERFSTIRKLDLFDTSRDQVEQFSYDVLRIINDAAFARTHSLEDLHYPVTLRIGHTDTQRATINRELAFYGSDVAGITMLISRFPIKRFWRAVTVVSGASEAASVVGESDLGPRELNLG